MKLGADVRWRLLGCGLALGGSVCNSLQGMVFSLPTSLFYMESLLARVLLDLLVCAVIIWFRRESLRYSWRENAWLTVSSACFLISTLLRYYAIVLIPYADVFALALSGIMLVSLVLGRLLLRETCGLFETLMCAVILLGMGLTSDPRKIYHDLTQGDDDKEWTFFIPKRVLGFILVMIDAAASAFFALCCRKVKHIHFSVMMLHVAVWSILLCALMTALLGRFTLPESWEEAGYLALFATLGCSFHFMLVASLAFIGAGAVSTIRTIEIALSYLFQFLFLHVIPGPLVAVGAAIVSVASFTSGIKTTCRQANTENEDDREDIGLLSISHNSDRN